MLSLRVKFKVDKENRGRFTGEFADLRRTVLEEEGCSEYTLYADAVTGELFLYEEWESAELLKKHMGQKHMKEFAERTSGLHSGAPDVKINVLGQKYTLEEITEI